MKKGLVIIDVQTAFMASLKAAFAKVLTAKEFLEIE